MASAISKRQQARNERTLQDLLRSVAGNDRCADCSAKNPGWASWNLGVFLCMRCAGLHRKLGTHVSKVKSLSMDSWTTEQVESMKKVGNVESNRRYNPRNVRPDIPIDADEVETALEKYIRQKYELRAFMPSGAVAPSASTRQNTGSTGTGSWSEEPPPLPPKPGKKFGFSLRSASAVLPSRHSKQDRNFTPPLSPSFTGSDRSGPEATSPREVKESKPSRMFGMKITSVSNNFDAKLATLRDMGFSDTRRNSDMLKSVNGNLDRAVEALVRLGEGSSNSASRSETPGPRALTPLSMTSQGFNGIAIDKTRQAEPKANNNPWEIRESSPQRAATQPLPQASAIPRSQSAAPAQNSWNPFLSQQPQQAQQQQHLENSFANLQVSQTGPAPQQQYGQQPMYAGQQTAFQNNPYQQPGNAWETQSMPPPPQQQLAAQPSYAQQQYQQPAALVAQPTDPSSNPFLRRAASQTFTPSNPWAPPPAPQQQAMANQQTGNPFGTPWQQQAQQNQNIFQQQPATQSPAPMYAGGQGGYFGQQQQPQQMQQSAQSVQQQQPQQSQPQQQQWPAQNPTQQSYASASNPWQQQQQQQPMMSQQTGAIQQQQPQQYQQAPQQQYQQQPQEQPWSYTPKDALPSTQPGRFDKSSILSLYNMQPQHQMSAGRPMQTLPEDGSQVTQQQQQYQQQQQQQQQQYQQPQQQLPQLQYQSAQQRSATMPIQQSANPFMAQQTGIPQGARHVSNESAAFVGMGGEGRHSPDAFAGLSARYVR